MRINVKRTDGQEQSFEITPALRFAFEQQHKKGWYKAFGADGMESDIFWLVWEACRQSGETVKPFGKEFVATLASVEVAGDDEGNG